MADVINTTIPLIEPWSGAVDTFMNALRLLVGGFFGLYVITFIYRVITFRKLTKQMNKLFSELSEIKIRLEKLENKGRKSKYVGVT